MTGLDTLIFPIRFPAVSTVIPVNLAKFAVFGTVDLNSSSKMASVHGQLKTVESIDNGARFYAGDLHIHTYGGSVDVKDAAMTVEAILDTAIAQDVIIVSITDHNNDKNV